MPALATTSPAPPLWLLLELTYKCPLHCVFCYNPVNLAQYTQELSTADWLRVLNEARELGAVQLGLSGGEPLLRDDLEIIVREAHRLGFYINLITSGIGLTESRIARLQEAGLDHIQLSFQDSTREMNDFLSHTRTFELKQRVATLIKAHGFPMVMNCVIHRHNIEHVGAIIQMAVDLEAEYLELANTQYYSWAHLNREQLLPSTEQLTNAERVVNEWRSRLDSRMKIFFVVPDYYESRPKRCVNGWGSTLLVVTPDGAALPCHTARVITDMEFPSIHTSNLRDAWYNSAAFNRFRGVSWMQEPCLSCDEREKDLGGCRCQAFMLTQDANAADPVCDKSTHHALIAQAVDAAQRPSVKERPLVFRDYKNSRAISQAAELPIKL